MCIFHQILHVYLYEKDRVSGRTEYYTDIRLIHFHSALQLCAAMTRSFWRVYRPRSIAEFMSVRHCFYNLIAKNPSSYNLGVAQIYFPGRVRPETS